MERRVLGSTDIEVSAVALGGGAMGEERARWGHVDDNESIAAVQTAIDLGINLIETAPSYGDGHSEEVLGKAIQGRRDAVVIATECGPAGRGRGRGEDECGPQAETIAKECDASLRRLRVDTIDVYRLSGRDAATPIQAAMDAVMRLREQGKIRAVALVGFDCEGIAAARRCGEVHCVQAILSLLNRRAAEDVIPYAREYGIGVLACSPLAKGLLTGRFDAKSRLADARADDPQFVGAQYRRNLAAIERLRVVAERYGKTVGQLAINWAANCPGVTAAVVGAKRPSQVRENTAAAGWSIRSEDMRDIELILRERN